MAEIGMGIADHGRPAGSPRGGMDPRQFRARYRKHTEGVIVAQIRFQRERKSDDIGQRLAIFRLHAGRFEGLPIMRNIRASIIQNMLQPFELELIKSPAWHGLDLAVEHEGAGFASDQLHAHD
jgi:hypothetical protein